MLGLCRGHGISGPTASVFLSIRVTEKYYAPWVPERQAALELIMTKALIAMGARVTIAATSTQVVYRALGRPDHYPSYCCKFSSIRRARSLPADSGTPARGRCPESAYPLTFASVRFP